MYQTVPEKYIFPPEKRPVNNVVHRSINLPVIDLRGGCIDSNGRNEIIRNIMKAGKEFGFFQVCVNVVTENFVYIVLQSNI
jgi:hypothetical protein